MLLMIYYLQQYQLELIDHVAGHLGFEEALTDSTSTVLNRMQIMNLACELGHQGCIDDSLAKWRRFREDPNNL